MTNYAIGRQFEYEIIRKLKELHPEALVMRTAGSHTAFDVWAIVPNHLDPTTGSLHLIQAKTQKTKTPTKQNREEWEKTKLIKIPTVLTVRKEFWIKLPKNQIIAWGEEK